MAGVIDRVAGWVAAAAIGRQVSTFERIVRAGPRVREAFLCAHLRRHADSGFGRDHGFAGIRDYGEFSATVPISTYEDLAAYILEAKEGNPGAIVGSSERLVMFAQSSGTTGEAKYIPVTERFVRGYRYGWHVFGLRSILDHPGSMFRPVVQVASSDREETAAGGLPCGAVSGLLARTQKWVVRRQYVAPLDVMHVKDTASKYYALMRCALPSRVAFAVTANPATLLGLFRFAERHAASLVRDIHDGTLSGDFDLPEDLRSRIARRYPPDRAAADRLERLVAARGRLRPCEYWDLKWVGCWIGGTLSLYLPKLREYIGSAPIRDIGLLASEGRITIPLRDERPEGVLDVSQNFFEFIPEPERESSKPIVLRPHELEVGRSYYVLLTNHTGLCRYDIGDCVRVTGFVGPTPVLEFLSRGSHVSSVTGEKLTERQVVDAMGSVGDRFGLGVESFVLAPRWADPPHYVLHVEADGADRIDRAALVAALDGRLTELNVEYASKRKSNRLAVPRVNVVPAGFFARLDAKLIAERRGRAEQYKHKYLYTRPGEDEGFPDSATS